MAVNANKSGSRLLAVLEQIARSQPIGARQLARDMEIEKSAVQRAMTTLAEAGWIQPAANASGWELSTRVLHVAHMAHGSNSLRRRARPVLDGLRDATGETAFLAIPDLDGFVVLEVAESRQSLRTVVPLGSILPANDTAMIHAALPYLTPEQRQQLIGDVPPERLREAWRKSMETGYSVAKDTGDENSITVAAPIFGAQGEAIGVVSVRAVSARNGPEQQAAIGKLLLEKQQELSASWRGEIHASDLRRAIGGFG